MAAESDTNCAGRDGKNARANEESADRLTIPRLLTPRLKLREMRASDLEPLTAIRSDPRVGAFTGGTRSRTDVWMTILRAHGLWSLLGYGYWIAEHRETGEIIAEVGFADFQRGITPDISGTPEAGWIIATPAWGQGYATEAMQAAHDWLDQASPQRATCIINPDNAASIRVAEKLGYREFALTDFNEDPIIVFERHSPTRRKG